MTTRTTRPTRRRAGTRRTRAGAVALAGALALALAACGGDTGDDVGTDTPPPPAASPTEEASPTADGAASNIEELNALLAPRQAEAGSVRVELTFAGAAAELAGLAGTTMTSDGFFTAEGTTAMRVTGSMLGQEMDLRLVDEVFYIGLGEAGGGMFMSLTREEMAADPDFAGLLEQFDAPATGAIQQFATDAVTSFEHTVADGNDVYTIGIDPSTLTDETLSTMSLDPAMAGLIEEMTVVTVVSQADGLPKSTTVQFTIEGETLEVVTSFSQWGQVPPVEAPAADLVVPYAEVVAAQ